MENNNLKAVEVLHSEKVLYLEKIKEAESRFNEMPTDIKKIYEKSNKVYKEFIDALDEALLWKEKLDRLEKGLDIDWLENEELESNLEARKHYAQFSDFIKNKYFKKEVLQNGK